MAINIADAISFKGNDINEGIKEALKGITKSFSVSMVDIDELEPSKDNFYGMREIEELQESIENFGIQQNLIVMKQKDNKKYEIIAGHRRYQACSNLTKEGKEEFRNIPCRILPTISDTLKNILIIHTNSETRKKTAWEITEEIERLKFLYRDYKKENPNFKGDVRIAVVKDTGLSRSVVGRHENIAEHLTEPLKQHYKEGKIGVTQADQIASLDEKQQAKAEKIIKEKGNIKTSEIKEIKEDLKKLEDEGQTAIKDFTEDNKDLTEEPESAVNAYGVYKEKFIKNITLEIPKKYGEITIHIAHDPKDDKYRTSYHYQFKNSGGGGAPHEDCRPFSSEQEALANMIDKLHTIGNEEIKAALKAGGYTKDKPKTEVRDIKFIVPTPPTEQPEQPDEYQQAAEKVFTDLLQKEIDIAERDIKKSTDSEEKQYISAYLQLLIKHRDKP